MSSPEPMLGCWAYRVTCYWTTLTYKFHIRVEESWREKRMLEIPHRLEIKPSNNL